MKSIFEIIQNTPYCSNCGEKDWIKNKKGEIFCVYCGHPMIMDKYCNRSEFKERLEKEIEKRKVR